jgi:serine/threonine-protein kinase
VVLPDLYGVAAPVDPGLVEIEAGAPNRRRYTTQVKIGPRAKEVVSVPTLEVEPGAEAPPVAPVAAGTAVAPTETPAERPSEAPPKDSAPASGPDHTLAYIVGGVGIIGIGVGSYFGLRAMSKNSDAEEFCNDANVCTDQQGIDLTQEAKDAALISNIGFAVGGAALATGIVLFIAAPGGDSEHAIRVAPRVAKNGAGLTIGGSFR